MLYVIQVINNVICNGLAEGVVVGPRGRGVIEGNTIKGLSVCVCVCVRVVCVCMCVCVQA